MSEVTRLSHGAKFTADVALVVVICGTCWDSTTVSYSALVADPCRVRSCFFHFGLLVEVWAGWRIDKGSNLEQELWRLPFYQLNYRLSDGPKCTI